MPELLAICIGGLGARPGEPRHVRCGATPGRQPVACIWVRSARSCGKRLERGGKA